MKTVLYVTTVSITINNFLLPHIEKLIKMGYKVQIASNIDEELSPFFKINKVKHTKVNFSRNPYSFFNIKAYKEIKELVLKEKFDIVHVHTPVAAFITRLALRKIKTKIIYTSHGFHFYKGAPIVNWLLFYPLELLAAGWTDRIITINKEDYERARKFNIRNKGDCMLMHGVGIKEIKERENSSDSKRKRKDLGLDEEDFLILVLAEINKNKNIIQGIEAIKTLKDDYPNIKLLCAGKGPLESKLKKKVMKLGLEENVKFIGFRSDVDEIIDSCDCLGLFSKREGLGKCLLEGIMGGLPIIATETRGAKEIIQNMQSGFLVKVGDFKNTANNIKKIYLNRKLGNDFSKEAKEVIKPYLLESVLSELELFYEFKE